MTDIQRHLKTILKVLHQQPKDLHPAIRAALPASYGVATGCVTDSDEQPSATIQLLIYDRPLAQGCYDETSQNFLIDHVLLVLDTAPRYTSADLQAALQRIASVKALVQRQPDAAAKPHTREKIPTHRLPVALIYCRTLTNVASNFFGSIQALLAQHPIAMQPDFIHFAGQQALYRNPLLDELPLTGLDIGLSPLPDLPKPHLCYVCKRKFVHRHFFYEKLCVRCGDVNYQKRLYTADLTGRMALVTGGRVKIGYAAALRLLRAGATVLVSSRFPHDTARRYSEEPDFAHWQNRLHIYGVDFRFTPMVEQFIAYLDVTYPHLDILINNAAQTVRRPPAYYAHLLPLERRPRAELPRALQPLLVEPPDIPPSSALALPALQSQSAAEHSQMVLIPEDAETNPTHFPLERYDEHQQQVDYRIHNSWTMRLDEVAMPELLEVHLINAIAPALLAGKLKPMFERSPFANRYIINVSAAEGQFAADKRGLHPHTNMAKAALNMLTRTSAVDYARACIWMNSVDPGWVSDQIPRESEAERTTAIEDLPIDMEDAAARICDPIFTGSTAAGCLFKDYQIAEW